MTKRSIARVIGLGSYLPKKVLTNQELEQMVDTSDDVDYLSNGDARAPDCSSG